MADTWMGRANNRELNDLVFIAATADSATWADLGPSDVYLLRFYALANIRLYETVFLHVEQKLLRGRRQAAGRRAPRRDADALTGSGGRIC